MAARSPEYKIVFTDDNKVIVSMIKAFTKGNARIHDMVHAIAVSCILHAVKHGNVTPANDFLKSFDLNGKAKTNGWRLNHLKEWFEFFGPFTWSVDKTAKTEGFKLNSEKRKVMLEQDMVAFSNGVATFWEVKRESEYKGFDLNAKIAALFREASNTLKDEGKMASGKVKINQAKLEALAALVNMGEAKAEASTVEVKLLEAPLAIAA